MALKKLTVQGFKSIKTLNEFQLNDLNVLIGANGSGKSNFIEIFNLLKNLYNNELSNYVALSGGANHLLYFGAKTTQDLYIDLTFKLFGDENEAGYRC